MNKFDTIWPILLTPAAVLVLWQFVPQANRHPSALDFRGKWRRYLFGFTGAVIGSLLYHRWMHQRFMLGVNDLAGLLGVITGASPAANDVYRWITRRKPR